MGDTINERPGRLTLLGPGSLVRGISLNTLEFPGQATTLLQVDGEDSAIEGSSFGTGGVASRGFLVCLGLALNGDGIRLGGTTREARNYIAGQCPLVTIKGNDVMVYGNYIGLSEDGNNPNAGEMQEPHPGGGIVVGFNGLFDEKETGLRSRIGGTGPGEGNVIAGVNLPVRMPLERCLDSRQ